MDEVTDILDEADSKLYYVRSGMESRYPNLQHEQLELKEIIALLSKAIDLIERVPN